MDTMETTHTIQTPKPGSTVWDCNDRTMTRTIGTDPHEHLILSEGQFVIESYHGYRTIGQFTGRTRRFFGLDCPTIERYEVVTIADSDGVIRGILGDRISGTWAIRPECVEVLHRDAPTCWAHDTPEPGFCDHCRVVIAASKEVRS